MKKFWTIVLFFLSLVALAGCQVETEPTVELLSFKVEVIEIDDVVLLSRDIEFPEGETKRVIDLIDESIGIDYQIYPFGYFVNGVGSLYPKEYGVTYNYSFTISVDGALITTGVENIELIDGMVITFQEVSLLDETDLMVDRVIQTFIENHLSTYVSLQGLEPNVVAALRHLNARNYFSPQLGSLVPKPSIYPTDTISNAFKSTLLAKSFVSNTDAIKDALLLMDAQNHYESISLLNALTMVQATGSVRTAIVDDLLASTPDFMDADYAGMLLLALAPYVTYEGVDLQVAEMITYIKENLSEDGVTSWGSANSASTATVIIGLIAHAIDPRGVDYQTEGVDLIEALLQYEVDGAFKWTLESEETDMMFSTPQVFAALVAYKIYRDVYLKPAFYFYYLG
jgi:hypothetical protein